MRSLFILSSVPRRGHGPPLPGYLGARPCAHCWGAGTLSGRQARLGPSVWNRVRGAPGGGGVPAGHAWAGRAQEGGSPTGPKWRTSGETWRDWPCAALLSPASSEPEGPPQRCGSALWAHELPARHTAPLSCGLNWFPGTNPRT